MGINTSIDVQTKYLKILRDLLNKHLPNTQVWAFGSRVKWTSRPDSDLDLVVFTTKEQSRQVHNLKDALQESSLPFRVDVLVWDNIPDTFRENILQQYFVLVNLELPKSEVMNSEWFETTLAEFADINPKRPIQKNAIAPFVDMAALPTHTRDISVESVTERAFTGGGSKFRNGDTLLARITPCLENGKTSLVSCLPNDTNAHGSTEFIVLSPKIESDKNFLYSLVRSDDFRTYAISRMEGTSGRQRVPNDAVGKYQFLCPPEKERQNIGDFLGALDDRITLLRETNATLEAIAQALFKSWFVDFDPVHAKQQGRLPEGMDEQTAALFPDSFEESVVGLVPAGWEVGTLGDELKIAYGKNLPTTKLLESGYPVFGGNGQIGFFDKYLYETRQVLVACRGAASGKVNQSVPKSFVTNNSLILESSEHSHIPFGYLKGYMSISNLTPFVTGSAQPQVTIDNLKNFKLLMPQVEIMQSYESFSRIVEDKIQSNSNQAQTLADLRDTLLPRLISGQLRVEDENKNE